jgi:hypothetical protein
MPTLPTGWSRSHFTIGGVAGEQASPACHPLSVALKLTQQLECVSAPALVVVQRPFHDLELQDQGKDRADAERQCGYENCQLSHILAYLLPVPRRIAH